MAYHLDYVAPPGGKFDEVVEQDGVRVLIDSKALFSIIGSRMDWRDNRLSAGFVFDKWVFRLPYFTRGPSCFAGIIGYLADRLVFSARMSWIRAAVGRAVSRAWRRWYCS